ncbi:hypothetical protein QFW85_26840 [Vibrio chagasii]|uniref:hypothetical protein n=1 Tax=Vibrio chagasii TaxID=170679 RepID=UPI003DA81A52
MNLKYTIVLALILLLLTTLSIFGFSQSITARDEFISKLFGDKLLIAANYGVVCRNPKDYHSKTAPFMINRNIKSKETHVEAKEHQCVYSVLFEKKFVISQVNKSIADGLVGLFIGILALCLLIRLLIFPAESFNRFLNEKD